MSQPKLRNATSPEFRTRQPGASCQGSKWHPSSEHLNRNLSRHKERRETFLRRNLRENMQNRSLKKKSSCKSVEMESVGKFMQRQLMDGWQASLFRRVMLISKKGTPWPGGPSATPVLLHTLSYSKTIYPLLCLTATQNLSPTQLGGTLGHSAAPL